MQNRPLRSDLRGKCHIARNLQLNKKKIIIMIIIPIIINNNIIMAVERSKESFASLERYDLERMRHNTAEVYYYALVPAFRGHASSRWSSGSTTGSKDSHLGGGL